jgi:energy-coupling factor transport system substrate-specific component
MPAARGVDRGRDETMNDLRIMWRDTRMVVLVAISAALYAAVLVPFKGVPLIPGVTELRPANAIPIVCSFLFGPAAAWGSAIGNMIGDFFGGVGPGDIFGFFGNLCYGYLPYKLWNIIASGQRPVSRSPMGIAKYVLVCLMASTLCADFVAWGENVIGLRPFWMLGNVIVLNNMVAAIALSPFLLIGIYPRVKRGRMLYEDVMPVLKHGPSASRLLGVALIVIGESGAWLFGNLISTGYWMPAFLPHSMALVPYDRAIAIMVSPMMFIAVAGVYLL